MSRFTMSKRGGYDPQEVDSYVASLESQLNDYKDKSSAINKAIISAQLAADKMIKSANDEAAKIIKSANDEKAKILSGAENTAVTFRKSASQQLTQLKNNITQQRHLINSFQLDYETLYNKYVQTINKTEVTSILNKLAEIEHLMDDFGKNKEASADPSASTYKAKPYAKTGMTHTADKPAEHVNPYAPTDKKPDIVSPYAPAENKAEAVNHGSTANKTAETVKPYAPVDKNAETVNPYAPVDKKAENANPYAPTENKTDITDKIDEEKKVEPSDQYTASPSTTEQEDSIPSFKESDNDTSADNEAKPEIAATETASTPTNFSKPGVYRVTDENK